MGNCSTSSQGKSQIGAIEPADLQLHVPKTFLECIIIIPNSNSLKCLDPDRINTAEELVELLCPDSDLFIEVSVLCSCVFLPSDTEGRFSAKALQQPRNLLQKLGFEEVIVLGQKFCFLVGSCPGWEAAFSYEICFQCNCPVFWGRCA